MTCMQVKMVYLIHVTQHEPRRLDLTNVWVLHAASRSIYKAAVDMRTETQDPAEMVLRIRWDCDTLFQHCLEPLHCALPCYPLPSAVTPCSVYCCLHVLYLFDNQMLSNPWLCKCAALC